MMCEVTNIQNKKKEQKKKKTKKYEDKLTVK